MNVIRKGDVKINIRKDQITALILAALCLLGLTGCGKDSGEDPVIETESEGTEAEEEGDMPSASSSNYLVAPSANSYRFGYKSTDGQDTVLWGGAVVWKGRRAIA